MDSVTALVVDDQPLIRYALRLLLEDSTEARVVNEAGTELEAIRQCENSSPNMVITELSISGKPAGAGICQFAKEHLDRAAVLVFASDSSPAAVATALNAGADSFVHKSVSGKQLISAVRSTLAGRRVWVLGGGTSSPAGEAARYSSAMTKREEEVLALMLCRWSNDEIAAELHLARQTVKNHVSRILRKLDFGSRRELFRSLRSDLDPCPAPGPEERLGAGD